MQLPMLRLVTGLASCVLPIAALAQEPTPSPVQEEHRTQNTFLRHRMFIHETVDRENDHRHYVQSRPIRWSRAFRLPTRMHYQELEIETACEWRTDDPDVGFWLPPFGTPSTLPTGPGTTPNVPETTPTIPGQPTIPSLTTTVTPLDPLTFDPLGTDPLDPRDKPVDPAGDPVGIDPRDEPVDPADDPLVADPRDKPLDPAGDPAGIDPRDEPVDPANDPLVADPRDEPVDPAGDPAGLNPRDEPADPANYPLVADPRDEPVNPADTPAGADPRDEPANPAPHPAIANPRDSPAWKPPQDPLETERLASDPTSPTHGSTVFPTTFSISIGQRFGTFVVNDNSSASTNFIDTVMGDALARTGTATKPTVSKSGALSGTFTESDSLDDGVPLTGPSLSLPFKSDVSKWDTMSWLPPHTRMELYAHAYFGKAEMLGVEFDMAIYGVGVRTILPLVGSPSSAFRFGGTVALGLGYMDSDVGELLGLEPALGLQATVHLYGNLAFNANLDYYFFITDGAVYEGPTVTGGLTIGF